MGFLDLAHVVVGEAGPLCSLMAAYAVAHVYQRNSVMYGKAPVTVRSIVVALTWHLVPDPTRGARYLLSGNDVIATPFGRRIARERGPPVASFRCRQGLMLYAYK